MGRLEKFLYTYFGYISSKRELAAVLRESDANRAFDQWCTKNPHLPVYCSEVARQLVLECIAAHEEFLRTHPRVYRDEAYILLLWSLLDPPPHTPPPASFPYSPVLRHGFLYV